MKNNKTTKQTKKPAFALYEGSTSIDAAIKSISTRGKALEKDVHKVAVSCLNHADKHGDITLAQKLVAALPSLARSNALKDWFIAYGKFSYDMEAKQLTFNRAAVTNLPDAILTPFWLFKAEPEYKPFNMQAAILRLVKTAEKAVEKGETVDSEALGTLRKLAVVSVAVNH